MTPRSLRTLSWCSTGVAGELVRGTIRFAFQMVEPAHGLQQRGGAPVSYPVQAVAIGRQVKILAVSGDAPAARFRLRGVTVAPFSNGTEAPPDTPEVDAAIRRLLARVR